MGVRLGRSAGWAVLVSLCLGVVGWLSGCGATLHGSVEHGVFRHEVFGYEIRSRVRDRFLPIGPDWKVDNLRESRGSLSSKTGPDYEVDYFLDINDDGKSENLGKFFVYDLRFVNSRNAGVVWLRTIPYHPDDAQRDLRVMAESFVAAMAGTHYETAQLEGNLYRTTSERTFATSIVHSAQGQIAGLEAYGVVVDVADVAQLELNPDARHKRVALVLIRTPFRWKLRGRELPVLMLAGYADLQGDFDPEARPLVAMLERLQVGTAWGVNLSLGVPPEPAPPPPSAAPPTPAVTDAGAADVAAPAAVAPAPTPGGAAPAPAPAPGGAAPAPVPAPGGAAPAPVPAPPVAAPQ